MHPDQPVAAVGERALIARLKDLLPSAPEGEIFSGDDAAVIATPGARLVITTDVLVEGFDFTLATFEPADIGWKALAASVSDVAAMGGTSTHAVATVTISRATDVAVFDGVAIGLTEAASDWDVRLVGGDVGEGAELSVGVTVVGTVERPVTRSGAVEGDAICVTGALGGARGGLTVLKTGADLTGLAQRQRRPRPLVTEGPALSRAGITAMIDVSDGLAVDLGHVLDASGVGCEVWLDAVPVDPDLRGLAGVDPVATAVVGGEDFELLFTTADVEAARRAVDVPVTQIGRVTGAGAAMIGDRSVDDWRDESWEHLRDR